MWFSGLWGYGFLSWLTPLSVLCEAFPESQVGYIPLFCALLHPGLITDHVLLYLSILCLSIVPCRQESRLIYVWAAELSTVPGTWEILCKYWLNRSCPLMAENTAWKDTLSHPPLKEPWPGFSACLEPAMNAIYTEFFPPRAKLLAKVNHCQPWGKSRPDFWIDFLLKLSAGYLAAILTPYR